jgi:hypothetical protein
LWKKLTQIRNNFKTELKKKQEERLIFENDIRRTTAQTAAEIELVERELERTNQEIRSMEAQICQAENYQKKVHSHGYPCQNK